MPFFYLSKHEGQDSMVNLFAFDFVFETHQFHCIARARSQDNEIHYRLLILDENMAEALPDQFVLVEKDGRLNLQVAYDAESYATLKYASGTALEIHLVNMRSLNRSPERFIA